MSGAELVAVPAKFWSDHEDRQPTDGQRLASPVGRRGRCVLIQRDDPGLKFLRADAEYYADTWGPDELPEGLKASAKRTVAALEKAGVGGF